MSETGQRRPDRIVSVRVEGPRRVARRVAKATALVAVIHASATGCSSASSTDAGNPLASTVSSVQTSYLPAATGAVSAPTASPDVVRSPDSVEAPVLQPGSSSDGALSIASLREALTRASNLAQQAVDRRVASCMSGFGFDYLAQPPAMGANPATAPARIWELPNPELASTSGYMVPGVDDAPELLPEPPASAPYDAALWGKVVGQWEDPDPPEYAGAPVGGDIYDGCLPTSRTAIVGDGHPEQLYLDHDLSYRLNDLVGVASDRLFADVTWLALEADWVACMQAGGYEYDSIFGPVSADWGSDRPSAVERETAIADAACKHRLDFAARADALYGRQVNALMNERVGELIEISAAIAELQKRAAAALTGS
jgi:hypothetical protein